MSRWRPPGEKSTALITRDGHDRLKAELDDLWRVRRPEVVKALAAAAAEGDRSENAEYTYRKKQLGEIDRRVRYLSKRLEVLRVVDTAPSDPDAVFFGGVGREISRLIDAAYDRLRKGGRLVANVGSIENLADVHAVLRRRAGDVEITMINLARGTFQLERVRFDALNPSFLLAVVKPT